MTNQTIQGYSNPALASPIRVTSIGSIPPRISDVPVMINRTGLLANNYMPSLTQRSGDVIAPITDGLSSPRYSPDYTIHSSPIIQPSPIIQQSSGPHLFMQSSPIQNSFIQNSPIIQPSPIQNSPIQPSPIIKQSPIQNSGLSLQNQGTIVKSLDSDINKKLEAHKYKILETINLSRVGGQREAKYVKAIDQRGHYVTIDLNLDSNIQVHPSDLTTMETVNINSNIPYSTRMGILNAAGKRVGGVAFECKNGICITSNSTRGPPKENFLTIIEKPVDRTVLENDSMLATPVIRLTDILANPTLASEITTESTIDIINAAANSYHSDIKETDKVISELAGKSKKALQDMSINMNMIIQSLNEYEKLRSNYELTIVPGEMYKKVSSTITSHINDISRLLSAGKRLEEIRNEINGLNQKLSNTKSMTDPSTKK